MGNYQRPSVRGLYIRQISAALIFAGVITLPLFFFPPFSFMQRIVIIPAALIYLFFALGYLPASYRRIVYTVNRKHIILQKGLFASSRQTVARDRIVLCSLIENPLTALFRVAHIHVLTPGARIKVTYLDIKTAKTLIKELERHD